MDINVYMQKLTIKMRFYFSIKSLSLFAAMFFSSNVFCEWYCDKVDQEISINSKTINICGLGVGQTNAKAQDQSRDHAMKKVEQYCDSSILCRDYEVIYTWERSDCNLTSSNEYECKILFSGLVTDTVRNPSVPRFRYSSDILTVEKEIITSFNPTITKRKIVKFNTHPSKARIEVNGIAICTNTPCSVEMEFKTYEVTIKKEDHESISSTISLSESSDEEYSYMLAPSYGNLNINDYPEDTSVEIDNIKVTTDGLKTYKLAPGQYIVKIINPNYFSDTVKIDIRRGETTTHHFSNSPRVGVVDISAKDSSGNAVPAEIYIDGEKQSSKTPTAITLIQGEHALKLVDSDNYYEGNITVQENSQQQLDVKLDKQEEKTSVISRDIHDQPLYFVLGGLAYEGSHYASKEFKYPLWGGGVEVRAMLKHLQLVKSTPLYTTSSDKIFSLGIKLGYTHLSNAEYSSYEDGRREQDGFTITWFSDNTRIVTFGIPLFFQLSSQNGKHHYIFAEPEWRSQSTNIKKYTRSGKWGDTTIEHYELSQTAIGGYLGYELIAKRSNDWYVGYNFGLGLHAYEDAEYEINGRKSGRKIIGNNVTSIRGWFVIGW